MSGLQARIALAFLVLSLLAVVGGCMGDQRDFRGLLGRNPEEVTKISLRCGTTGELVEVAGDEEMGEFIALLEGKTFEKAKDQARRVGYRYYADFHRGDDTLLRLTFQGDLVSVNQTYYQVTENIPQEKLDAFFAGWER